MAVQADNLPLTEGASSANSVIHLISKERPVSGGQETLVLIAVTQRSRSRTPPCGCEPLFVVRLWRA